MERLYNPQKGDIITTLLDLYLELDEEIKSQFIIIDYDKIRVKKIKIKIFNKYISIPRLKKDIIVKLEYIGEKDRFIFGRKESLMIPTEYRNKHKRCRYCQYFRGTKQEIRYDNFVYRECTAKDKVISYPDIRRFCKMFKAKEFKDE